MAFSFGNFQFNPNQQQIDKLKSIMCYNKKSRFIKGLTTPFYLLGVEKMPESICVNISGSSGNVYKVKYDETIRKFSCNCPDGQGYCHHRNHICKHSYFLIFKVLMMWDFAEEETRFILENILNEAEGDKIRTQLMELYARLGDDGLLDLSRGLDPTLYQRYQRFNATKEEPKEEGELEDKFKCLSIEGDTMCPICYNDFQDGETLLKCPTCNNQFHKNCMEMWLRNGKSTCVLCREPVWQEYKDKHMNGGEGDFNLQYENIYRIHT